jgi:hypothetical protein
MSRLRQRLPGLRLLGLVLLILIGLPALAQDGSGTQLIGGDEAGLREFILRAEGLLAAADSNVAVTIRIEALPEDLPFTLPLPEGSRPVGSIAIISPDGAAYRLLIDTPLEPAAVLDFFIEALAASPWRLLEIPGSGGMNAMFCHGQDTSVNINALRLPTGATDLQIYVNQEAGGVLCGDHADFAPPRAPNLLPELPDLPDVTVETSAEYIFGTEMAVLAAGLRSDLPLADLLAAYDAALADSGWMRVRSESGTGLASSTWTLTDPDGQPWEGVLTLTASAATPDRYQAQISVRFLGED